MDKFDRFQLLHRVFKSHRYPVPIKTLADKLECGEKTVKRSMEQMRDYLDARGILRSTFDEHIRIIPLANRQIASNTFTLLGEALLRGKRVDIHYKSYTCTETRRTLSRDLSISQR